MSGAAQAVETAEKRFKTHGTDWWTPPPNMPLNAGIPYVVQIVEDALSLIEWRILKLLTSTNDGTARKHRAGEREGFLCDPGGYSEIARRVGVCRKTARNAIKSLIQKGVLREWERVMQGKQRLKTVYFAPHYGEILGQWRAEPRLFKTDRKRVVVRGRRKELMTVDEAARFQIDPKRAPKRGSGRGLSEFAQEKSDAKQTPAPEPLPSDEDVNTIREVFLKCCPASLKDAIDIIRIARAEGRRLGFEVVPAAIIATLILKIAHEYKSTPEWPAPRPGWFIQEIVGQVAYWVKWSAPARAPAEQARTG